MQVLVIGSSRCLEDPADRKAFETAGEELGRALAERGHTLLIGTDDPVDIDPHVVRGARKAGRKVAIEAHVPHGVGRMFAGDEWKGALVEHYPHQFPDWDVTALEMIRTADAVLAIGGRTATVHAGVSAWMMGKAVVPIASFGGGAKTVWDYGSASRASFYRGSLNDLQIDRLASSWDGDAEAVVAALEQTARARAVSGPWLGRLLWIMAFALVGWIGCLIPWREPAWLWQLFPAAVFAGSLGSGIRTLRIARDGAAVTSQAIRVDLGLGLASGLVTAMLYLLAQVGVNGKVDLEIPGADFARVTLIASVAALFAGMYLDLALARFDKAKGHVFEGTYGRPGAPSEPSEPGRAGAPRREARSPELSLDGRPATAEPVLPKRAPAQEPVDRTC